MADSSFNRFSEIAEALTPLLHTAVTNTAQDIAEEYSATCAFDTGYMSSSSYIVSSDESTYGETITPVRESQYLLPEVEKPDDEYTAIAAVGAQYAADLEFGTVRQSPQPAFYPAVDKAESVFEDELSNVVDELEAQFR